MTGEHDQDRRARLRVPKNGRARGASDVIACREHLGLSRDNFARLFGLSPPRVKRWEEGGTAPGAWYLEFCRVLTRTPKPDAVDLASKLSRQGAVNVFCDLVRRSRRRRT